MKKLFHVKALLLLSLMFLFLTLPLVAQAYSPQVTVTKSKESALANNTDYITLTITPCAVFNEATGLEAIPGGTWSLTGTATAIGNPIYTGFPENPGGLESISCGVGKVTWQVKSTTAGLKTLTIRGTGWPGLEYSTATTVTFTAAATNSTPTSTTNKATTGTTTTASTPNTPPAIPALNTIAGNSVLDLTENKEITLDQNEKKIFSGKTVPNGVVKLYFQSEPFEDTATADSAGVWSYELTRDLGAGEHSLQITVTDPATNLTSEKSAPVKFTLVADAKTEVKAETKNWTWYLVGGGIGLVALLGGVLGFLIIRRKRNNN